MDILTPFNSILSMELQSKSWPLLPNPKLVWTSQRSRPSKILQLTNKRKELTNASATRNLANAAKRTVPNLTAHATAAKDTGPLLHESPAYWEE